MCKEFYNNNNTLKIEDEGYIWTPEHGISPACLQFIYKVYIILAAMPSYDLNNKCFLKNIGNINCPLFCYYAIAKHRYLIGNKEKLKSLSEFAKTQKEINFLSSILKRDEKINYFYIFQYMKM